MAEKHPDWRIAGDWFDLCSCAIGCPCVFGGRPTTGVCEGVLTWIVRDGNYGEVSLSGFNAILVVHFEGGVLEKNRHFGFLIDDRADEKQRAALKAILTGTAGGRFAAWRDLTVENLGVEFVPIRAEASADAEDWRVEVPGMIDGLGGPYRDLMVPDGQVCRIVNAPRPEVGPGDITVGQARRNLLKGFGYDWDHATKSAKHIPFDLRGPDAFSWRRPLEHQ